MGSMMLRDGRALVQPHLQPRYTHMTCTYKLNLGHRVAATTSQDELMGRVCNCRRTWAKRRPARALQEKQAGAMCHSCQCCLQPMGPQTRRVKRHCTKCREQQAGRQAGSKTGSSMQE